MAEQHPVGFQWVMEAKRARREGHPRRPALHAHERDGDLHAPIRAGTDIVFLGALISHVLENGREFREYVRYYTNAARDHPRGLQGHRGARRPVLRLERRRRRPTTSRELGLRGRRAPAGKSAAGRRRASVARRARLAAEEADRPEDWDLEHPNCVFQLTASATSPATRPRWSSGSAASRGRRSSRSPRRCATTPAPSARRRWLYAVGWTQHTTGVQNIRAAAILQLLLGNIGRPGGGHPRAARPREHPGLDGHPDAVRHPAGLHPDAAPLAARRSTTG